MEDQAPGYNLHTSSEVIRLNTNDRSYEVPDNERERLEHLHEYGILDTPPEPAFDHLTELASRIFDVPIALLCLVDEDRQWFKSRVGIDRTETERRCAFCNHVLLSQEITSIEDTLDDPRLEDDPPLLNLVDVRSYLGAPLKTEDGYIIGTFCLLDRKPRTYSGIERDILNRLAEVAMDQIDLRYKNSERGRLNRELQDELRSLYEQVERQEMAQEELIHRTKNSFQQVRSLLRIRRRDTKNRDDYRALELAETKLHAFMTLYEQLSISRTGKSLPADEYFEGLIQNVQDVFAEEFSGVSIVTSLESTEIDAETAAKFGIALNELVTNAFQHVFLEKDGSELQVIFRVRDRKSELIVQDDGPGLPVSSDGSPSFRRGLKLIRDMIEHNGNGSFGYDYSDGARFTITMPREE